MEFLDERANAAGVRVNPNFPSNLFFFLFVWVFFFGFVFEILTRCVKPEKRETEDEYYYNIMMESLSLVTTQIETPRANWPERVPARND